MGFIDKLIECIRVLFLGKSIDSVVTSTQDKVVDTVNNTVDEVSSKVDNITNTVDDKIDDVSNKVEDIVENSKKLGINIRKK